MTWALMRATAPAIAWLASASEKKVWRRRRLRGDYYDDRMTTTMMAGVMAR
jgi:hypothetical protein